jgi:predicted PurR-regulated permease PerM
MTAKKFLQVVLLAMFFAIALPAGASIISPAPYAIKGIPTTEDPRVQQLVQRLEVIKDMDKSDMTRLQRKGLRKEVKEIKKEMKAISGGVYLSVGAIIIIILLLILIL